MLVDEAVIHVKAGNGGNGLVHFRREKFVPKGGPDGGDGGDGGDVWLVADPGLHALSEFARVHEFAAEKGETGRPKKQTGADGADRILRVLPGTEIWQQEGDTDQWHLLADLAEPGQKICVARGGRGGRGNVHFATPVVQAPQYAEKGQPGAQATLRLQLKLLADVGLIGRPNAGKSSLLARITAAQPKIANYPFTTLEPNLGVVDSRKIRLPGGFPGGTVIADIPGLIEGASHGRGLGDQFLRHIERTQVLVHLVDGEASDHQAAYTEIRAELTKWGHELVGKPEIVVISKSDILSPTDRRKLLKQFGKKSPLFISAATGEGLDMLLRAIADARARTQPLDKPEQAD